MRRITGKFGLVSVSSALALLLVAGIAVSQEWTRRRSTEARYESALTKLPNLVAVNVYSQWSDASQELEPIVRELVTQLGPDSQTLVVTMDLSDESTRRQGRLLMSMLRLENVYEGYRSPGKIVVANSRTGEILGTLTGDLTAAEMAGTIQATQTELEGGRRTQKTKSSERSTRHRPVAERQTKRGR